MQWIQVNDGPIDKNVDVSTMNTFIMKYKLCLVSWVKEPNWDAAHARAERLLTELMGWPIRTVGAKIDTDHRDETDNDAVGTSLFAKSVASINLFREIRLKRLPLACQTIPRSCQSGFVLGSVSHCCLRIPMKTRQGQKKTVGLARDKTSHSVNSLRAVHTPSLFK